LSIKIYYDQIKYRIHKTGEIKRFLEKVIADENKTPGDLIFIFTNDENILDLNRKYMKHDYYTDVISFNYSEKNTVNGEIYISLDTIKRNAILYQATIREELMRVIIHGLLHLCGYRDENAREKEKMFAKQEKKIREFAKRTE
jgi:probable rRNA maturation factor